jgi:dTDP-glucose 4,6-dehydratase
MNIYGERQNPEKYIPMCIEKIKNDERLQIHINTKTNTIGSRCYLHAQDVADALLFLLKLDHVEFPKNHRGGKCPKFNISSSVEINNLEIAQLIASAMNKDLNYELVDPNIERPGHDFRYLISGEYLKTLGWKQKIETKERLKQLVQWYINGEK